MESITVVFYGGNLSHSTKDNTHLRGSNGKQGRNILPTPADTLVVKKNEFLINKHKKQEFLLMLGNQISDTGISVYNANTDADFITVTNALALAKDYPVTVIRHSRLLVKKFSLFSWVLTLFRMGLLGAAHGLGAKRLPLPKICHTYPTMIKLGIVISYLKKSQKGKNHVTQPLNSTDISIFLPEINNFCHIKNY